LFEAFFPLFTLYFTSRLTLSSLSHVDTSPSPRAPHVSCALSPTISATLCPFRTRSRSRLTILTVYPCPPLLSSSPSPAWSSHSVMSGSLSDLFGSQPSARPSSRPPTAPFSSRPTLSWKPPARASALMGPRLLHRAMTSVPSGHLLHLRHCRSSQAPASTGSSRLRRCKVSAPSGSLQHHRLSQRH
jgi:hypothetical protein